VLPFDFAPTFGGRPIFERHAKALKAAFEEADKEVKTKGTAAIDGQADVILALAKMQAILSQRGKEEMRREAGVNQSWTEYYKWFQKEFNYDLTLRAIQYKIGELAGKKRKRKCSECHKTDGHVTSCSKYKEPPPPHLTQLEAKLLDATSRAHEVVKAVKQSGNVNESIVDFEKNAPTPEKLVEYAERPVKPSVADASTKLSKQPSNGLDYRKMLIDLLDQIERLGSRLPVELHMTCKQSLKSVALYFMLSIFCITGTSATLFFETGEPWFASLVDFGQAASSPLAVLLSPICAVTSSLFLCFISFSCF